MTLKGLDIQEDCIKAISNESLIFDIKNKEFLEDIENLLLQYFQNFSNDLNGIEFDNFSVEFWFDAGQLIIYPEKDLLDHKPFESEYDLDRLDPYFYLVCEEYRIYFDDLISRKVSDQVSEKEEQIAALVVESLEKRQESEQLLDQAKSRVEQLIEEAVRA